MLIGRVANKYKKAQTPQQIILETLDQINKSYSGGAANALTSTESGEVDPDAAYLELIKSLLKLNK